MEIEVTIDAEGNSAILAVSTIEDLWHDYEHFRDAASAACSEEPAFEQKRFLRAALMMFVAHCTAVVDRWCRKECVKEGKEQVEKLLRKCLELKCEYLAQRAELAEIQSPKFGFKKLRNRIVHAANDGDLELFRALSPSLLNEAEAEMVRWFDAVGAALKYERFVSTSGVVEDFATSDSVTKSISTEPTAAI